MRALTRLRNHVKLISVILISVVLYNEFAIYYLQSFKWPRLECASENECVRILLVADPQILGEQSESAPLKYLFNWDGDRYLSKTYANAVAYFKPNVVLFLGDIMDEGTIATKKEFHDYVRRVFNIFSTTYPIQHVWIPGDNDIGGENEPVYPDKVKQFNEVFKQPDVISTKNVDFYKVNNIIPAFPKLPFRFVVSTNKTNVVISHMPLLLSPGKFTENVFLKIQPSVIFSAHKHSAFHLQTTLDAMFVSKIVAITPQDNEIININFQQDTYHEFIVPTCSYRMGVPNMGYSAAVIDKSKYLKYSVLWSPRRFEQLRVYAIVMISVILYTIMMAIYKISSIFCRNKIQYSKV